MRTRFACPSCGVTVKTAQPVAPGKRVRCPKCAKPITVPADEEEAAAAEPEPEPAPQRKPAARKAIKSAADEDASEEDREQEEERPRKSRKKARKQALSPVLLWSLIGGGAGVVVIGAVVLIVVLSGNKGSGTGAPQKGDGKGDAKAGGAQKYPELIVGKWQATPDTKVYRTMEYRKDGTCAYTTTNLRGDGTYEFLGVNRITITTTRIDPPVDPKVFKLPHITQFEVQVEGDRLELWTGERYEFDRVK